jgi:DNA repair photolyase
MIMQKWYHQNEEWGNFVDVRINAPELLEKEIQHKKNLDIYMSSMTDPYQPVEEKYQITRKILSILLEKEKSKIFPSRISITIQTKNVLVLRDLDLISQFNDITVGLTITTLEEKWSKIFEKGASKPEDRLNALRTLNSNKIRTYVFVGPIMPYVSNNYEQLFNIVKEAERAGTEKILFDSLNYFPNLKRLNLKIQELGLYDAFKACENSQKLANLKNIIIDLSKKFQKVKFDVLFKA